MWALYFVLVLVSLYTVSSALSSEIYKSLSVGRLNPILKHALMLAIGICSAILLSRCSGRFYRYTLPPLSALLMVGLFFAQLLLGQSTMGQSAGSTWASSPSSPPNSCVSISSSGARMSRVRMSWKTRGRSLATGHTGDGSSSSRSWVLLSNLSTFLIIFSFLYLYSWVLKAPKRFMYRITLSVP